MPRGRPPLSRTREEAQTVRRSQVRKNVQAFRKRQQHEVGPECPLARAQDGKSVFILEDVGQWSGGVKVAQCPGLKKAPSEQTHHDSFQGPHIDDGSSIHGHRSVSLRLNKLHAAAILQRARDSSRHNFLVLPQEINEAKVCRQQLSSNAISAFSPFTHETFSTSTSSRPFAGPHWSQIIPDLVNRNVILDSSIQALCIMQTGHVNQEQWLLQQSLHFYDKALKGLQGALARPQSSFQAELFASINVLATYEILQGRNMSGKGWMYHIEGATKYLNMFPDMDVTTFSHQLAFHFLEMICIFDALGARRPACFSGSEWWKKSMDIYAGAVYGALLRMLTTLPDLLAQCDQALSLPSSDTTLRVWTQLLQRAYQTEAAFLEWYQELHKDDAVDLGSGALAWSAGDETVDYAEAIAPAPTQVDINFPSIGIARLYLLYWPSLILLYECIFALCQKIQLYDPSIGFDQAIHTNSYTKISMTFASYICRSIPFCTVPDYGITGKSMAILPLYIAGSCFRRNLYFRQARECEDWLDRMGYGGMTFGLKVKKGL